MVKKTNKTAGPKLDLPAGLLDSQLAQSVKESAQQIWLAGMGAFAKAQEEGTKVFEALVKEGVTLQKRTQAAAEEKLSEASNRMTSMATDLANGLSHYRSGDVIEALWWWQGRMLGETRRLWRQDRGRTMSGHGAPEHGA